MQQAYDVESSPIAPAKGKKVGPTNGGVSKPGSTMPSVGNFEVPANHKELLAKYGNDISNCPAFMMKGYQPSEETKRLLDDDEGKAAKKLAKQMKQNQQPMGGCPFMQNPENNNPALEPLSEGYPMPYISPFDAILNTTTHFVHYNKNYRTSNRPMFDSYPIYLKHTLFYVDPVIVKARGLEVSSKFVVFDELSSMGNAKYLKGKYEKALSFYEQALSCLKWIEYIAPLDNMGKKSITHQPEIAVITANFDDENTSVVFDEEGLDDFEKDTRDSMLVQLYLNIACCYIRLFHFKEALQALDDGLKISKSNSQLLYRKSQAIGYNKFSTYEELKHGRDCIEAAIATKKNEKVFQSDKRILLMMNLANADEAYSFQREFMTKRIEQIRIKEKEFLKKMLIKVKDVLFVEETLKKKEEPTTDPTLQAQVAQMFMKQNEKKKKIFSRDFEVVQEVIERYLKIMEFHKSSQRTDQVDLARKELNDVMKLYTDMSYIINLDFSKWDKDELLSELAKEMKLKFNMADPHVIQIIDEEKEGHLSLLFAEAGLNKGVLAQATQEYMKRTYVEEPEEEEKGPSTDTLKGKVKYVENYLKTHTVTTMVIMLLLVAVMYYMTRNTKLLTYLKIMFHQHKKK